MAGRGRGKSNMSFNTEQLGVTKGELPAQVLQPPPAYPMLDLHISNFESTNELDYLVELKREFAEYMRDSVNNVLPDVQKKDIERYSDHYQDTITDSGEHESKYDWSRMPRELSLQKCKKTTNKMKRKTKNENMTTGPKKKRRRIIDDDDDDNVQNTGVNPEQQKNKQTQDNTEEKEMKGIKEEENEEEENEEDSEEEMEEYQEVDKEMDDGTDYVNNYFDNGEGYDDDDDNPDDGPIY